MLQPLRKKNKASNSLVAYLLACVKKYRDHVAELTSSAEQRLARVLLRLARSHKNRPAPVEIPIVSHQVLAEMGGTTRREVNLFMNRYRKREFINYGGGLEVHQSLRKVLRSHQDSPLRDLHDELESESSGRGVSNFEHPRLNGL